MIDIARATRSPYVVGAGLGLVSAFAFATVKRGLGVTTAFESAAALTAKTVAPRATQINAYLKEREELPKIDWESMLVVGVLAGSYLTAKLTGERARGDMPPRSVVPVRAQFA